MKLDYKPNNVHISLFHAVSTSGNKCELVCVSRSMSRSFNIKLEKISEF